MAWAYPELVERIHNCGAQEKLNHSRLEKQILLLSQNTETYPAFKADLLKIASISKELQNINNEIRATAERIATLVAREEENDKENF